MRSVAHDMGWQLGCGAHLQSLRRTAVAEFDITQAHTLIEIESQANDCHPGRNFAFPKERECAVESLPRANEARREGPAVLSALVAPFFIHPRQLLPHFPSVTADEPTAARIRSGRPVNLPELSRAPQVKVFQGQSDLIAIATRLAGTLFHPKIAFPQTRRAGTLAQVFDFICSTETFPPGDALYLRSSAVADLKAIAKGKSRRTAA
jgi:tRNA pseudouridine55 synthase